MGCSGDSYFGLRDARRQEIAIAAMAGIVQVAYDDQVESLFRADVRWPAVGAFLSHKGIRQRSPGHLTSRAPGCGSTWSGVRWGVDPSSGRKSAPIEIFVWMRASSAKAWACRLETGNRERRSTRVSEAPFCDVPRRSPTMLRRLRNNRAGAARSMSRNFSN